MSESWVEFGGDRGKGVRAQITLNSQPARLIASAFIAGSVWATGLHMAFEDALGLERYLAFVSRNWVDLSWMVGGAMALGAVLVAFGAGLMLNRWCLGLIEEVGSFSWKMGEQSVTADGQKEEA